MDTKARLAELYEWYGLTVKITPNDDGTQQFARVYHTGTLVRVVSAPTGAEAIQLVCDWLDVD